MDRQWHLAIIAVRQELAQANARAPRIAAPPPEQAAPRTIIVEDVEEIERQEDQQRAAQAASSNKITPTAVADMD